MSTERQRFVDAMGDMLAGWNLPRATGRVYGHLLLRGEPSSSEELRDALSLSSGAVSTAIRELVSWGLARTIPQPGSRRLFVEAAGGFEQLLAASHERTRMFIRTLQAAEQLTEDADATQRLRDVVDMFAGYVDAGERILRERARPPQ
ncbi:GbsR/MarR family transcriptional regulator [Protaetiibacter intestinalis]|uniref:Transcriptional regulator n=1 Tax=Protaetiibacter intestinalis TaxID=2419774 RepID=A0A387BM01_9MICO|nr:MarR family transcriptional regulator [Protaetiibacter intestinalis]AYF99560.1 transcriptional regulator [Protaetiibacter intestinalis]